MDFDNLNIDQMLNTISETPPSGGNTYNSYNNKNKNFKQGNYTKKKDLKNITPIKPDVTKFIASPIKTFTIDLKSCIAGGKSEEVVKLAKILFAKGFVYRSPLEVKGNDEYNSVELDIRKLEKAKVEGYKVWSNMVIEDTDGLTIATDEPSDLSYQYAYNYNPHFSQMSDVIKRFMARQMHIYLGKELLQPVNVIITYTKCGSLKLSKNFDYKASGQASGYIKMANEFDASLFNLGNPEFLETFSTYLKAIAD